MASRAMHDGRSVVTTCGGCYADCAFAARVEDGRVVAELPVPGHPCAARALCARGRHRLAMPFDERDRILHPMRRRRDGSGFDAITWDEAFAQIAERLLGIVDERGPRALGMTLGVPSFDRYWAYRFMHALGSPNVYGADGACEVSRLTGWEHSLGYSPASDLAHTDCIMYLGRSIVDSSTMGAVDALNDARRRGAKIIVVDPRRSGSAAIADRWLRVRPGCDLALLLGIVHVLIAEGLYDHEFVDRYTTGFDELAQAAHAWTPEWAESMCDVPAAEIVATARDLAAAAPAAVVDAGFHGGIGIAYANSTQTARAICLVDVLLGCIGHAGGALNPPTPLVLGDLDPTRFATPPVPRGPKLGSERYPLVDPVRGLCTTVGQSILAGDLRGLIVYASNPGAGYGNAGAWLSILEQLDLLVTIDIRWSETARASDFVLPDVTYLEADRGVGTVVGANDARVFYRNAVLPVQHDDTRPGREIFAALAQACGVCEYFQFTSDDLAAAQVAPYGIDLDELKERGWADTGVALPTRTGEPMIPLAGGKIALASDVWERAGLGRVPDWIAPMVEPGPGMFRLISGNRPFESHTSRRLAVQGAAEAGSDLDAVQMNADAAAHMGIADGEIVELVSDMGRDRVRVETTPYLHPACIFTSAAPGGRSFGADAGGAQALGVGPLDHTPLRWDPLTGAALTQENAVRVEKIAEHEDNNDGLIQQIDSAGFDERPTDLPLVFERLHMSDSQNMSDEVRARLRAIPSVNELLAEWPVVKAAGETCDAVVHAAVTAELDEERAAIRAGAAPRSKRDLASAIEWRAHRSALPSLRPAVNATGVVIHTNLGRAPLAESAAKAVAEVARGYSTLEYSVDTCSRGSRKEHAAQLIRSLTGADDALVVNNNAAAVLLVLATHAAGKEVIVSRGELVEIGGSFRIPDVMEASGAKLVEVGATNRTHLSDYERAITPDTAMILKVHPSNYRIEGFHEEVSSRELAALAHKHGLLFYEDQGSGALLPDDILVRGGEETTPASVAAGLDIVSCSGDKLLGAAQAGIIMGRRDLVQACGSHPLMRALRPGKLALAALEATLRIYMDGADVAHREVPVLNMLTLPQAHLERRARKLRDLMVAGLDKAGCPCAVQVEIVEESSTPGGGSLPTVELPTMCVAVHLVDERLTVDALKRSLVQDFDTPIVTRTSHDRILFDVRTLVGDRDIETAASTLAACVAKAARR